MRRLALLLWAAAAAAQDPGEQLRPQLKKFVDVMALALDNAADPVDTSAGIYQGAIPGLMRRLDPFSVFFDPLQFEQLKQMERAESRGFGTIVSILPGRVVILQTQPGSPSARAGLNPGDEIVAINNYVLALLDTDQLIQLLSQSRQQAAKLDVRRPNSPRLLQFILTPENMDAQSVDRAFLLEPGIGYVRVASFDSKTGTQLKAAIEQVGGAQLKALVLDLRNNPGGVVGSALEAASLFLKPGQRIVSARGRQKKTEDVDVPASAQPYSMPLAVLVNAKTASAAEILASALQDNGRAVVAGERTYGKGLVQSVYPLSEGTGIALTTAYYYTPKGKSLQKPLRDSQIGESGEGGLQPSISYVPPALSRLQYVLEANGAFTDYARRLRSDVAVTPQILDDFQFWLTQRNIQPSVADWTRDRAWIESRLRQEILNLSLGVEKGDEVEMMRDPLVRRALEALIAGK
jgi:carboxyl-terminal processing protease